MQGVEWEIAHVQVLDKKVLDIYRKQRYYINNI